MAIWIADGDFGVVRGCTTTRADGDFAIDVEPRALAARRRVVVDRPWVWLRQVHGVDVEVVTAANAAAAAGREADALVTADAGLVLAIQTADCVPVLLSSPEGVIGAAHAGWRGLEAGVIERTIEAMRRLGATEVRGAVGPSIRPECYEFGERELAALAERFGGGVCSTTSEGTPALDLSALFRVCWRRAGGGAVTDLFGDAACTACHPDQWYSHRARHETARMATIIWREPFDAAADPR